MKKTIITVVSILIMILVLIIIIVNFSKSGYEKNLDSVKKSFLKNNNVTNISKISVYSGIQKYYVVEFIKNNIEYIDILDKNQDLIISVKRNELIIPKEIKNVKYTIGYKDSKIVYEIKKNSKNGFIYYYYDGLTGEFIKSIKLNK